MHKRKDLIRTHRTAQSHTQQTSAGRDSKAVHITAAGMQHMRVFMLMRMKNRGEWGRTDLRVGGSMGPGESAADRSTAPMVSAIPAPAAPVRGTCHEHCCMTKCSSRCTCTGTVINSNPECWPCCMCSLQDGTQQETTCCRVFVADA